MNLKWQNFHRSDRQMGTMQRDGWVIPNTPKMPMGPQHRQHLEMLEMQNRSLDLRTTKSESTFKQDLQIMKIQ